MQLFSEYSVLGLLLAGLAGYLLGNFQTAIVLSKLLFHDDVRDHGSGNAGSTNMVRVFGFRMGLVTFIGDFLKAVLAILLGRLLAGTIGGYMGGLFVVVGHCWPVFAGFRGGKGIASSFAVAWMCYPLGGLITTVAAALLFLSTKQVSVMSLGGTLVFFLCTIIFKQNPLLITLTVIILLITFTRHMSNIKRLLQGKEYKFIR